MRAPVDGLNLVLHDATVLDVELGPDDLTCDIPPELANQIRPRFPEMSRERLSPPGWLRRLGRSHRATGRCRGRPTVGKDPQVVRKRRVDVVTKDDSTSSEMAALPGDRRAKVTADVQRPNGRVVTVRFLIFRNADLGDVIARAEVVGGGVCVANHVVWPARRQAPGWLVARDVLANPGDSGGQRPGARSPGIERDPSASEWRPLYHSRPLRLLRTLLRL